MRVETCHSFIFVQYKKNVSLFYPFLGIFSTLPSTQTIKVIGQIIFLGGGHEKLGYAHALQPCT